MSPESDRDSSGVENGDGRDSDNSSWETFSLSDQRVPFTSGSSSSRFCISMDDDSDDSDDFIAQGCFILDNLYRFEDDDDNYDFLDRYHRIMQPLFLRVPSVDGSLGELFNGDGGDGDNELEGETTSVHGVGALAEEGLRNVLQRLPPWVLREEELRFSGDDGDDEGDGGGVDRDDDDDDADDGHGDDDDDDASEGETFFFNSADTAMAANEFVSGFSLQAEVFNPERFPRFAWEDRLSAIASAVANMRALMGDVNEIQFPPSPASSALISSLPVFFINDNVLEQICTICCCEFVRTDQATTLPCRHLFHMSCIEQWLKKSATCPVCRYHLEEEAAGSTPFPPPQYRGSGQRL